ncbi:hypothetical protein [uncultured Paraglaciecola sp.]|uniref:hypothetical protein n=1 Tax=uncultured Paraglaciecola sp. TaxID=1765024 RepID=UPI002631D168|nr:hypothetical protein [uncultured Paraglaciecola sp.]
MSALLLNKVEKLHKFDVHVSYEARTNMRCVTDYSITFFNSSNNITLYAYHEEYTHTLNELVGFCETLIGKLENKEAARVELAKAESGVAA